MSLPNFYILSCSGLTQSDRKNTTLRTRVNLYDKATLPCPVLNKGENYSSVTWWVCTSNVSCDGEEPGWKWIAGLNSQGGTSSEKREIYMSQDGSLNIISMHLKDVTTYQCRVTPLNGADPKDYYVTLFLKDEGKNCINRTFFVAMFFNLPCSKCCDPEASWDRLKGDWA